MSSYKGIFGAGSAEEEFNPVSFSYWLCMVGEKTASGVQQDRLHGLGLYRPG